MTGNAERCHIMPRENGVSVAAACLGRHGDKKPGRAPVPAIVFDGQEDGRRI